MALYQTPDPRIGSAEERYVPGRESVSSIASSTAPRPRAHSTSEPPVAMSSAVAVPIGPLLGVRPQQRSARSRARCVISILETTEARRAHECRDLVPGHVDRDEIPAYAFHARRSLHRDLEWAAICRRCRSLTARDGNSDDLTCVK